MTRRGRVATVLVTALAVWGLVAPGALAAQEHYVLLAEHAVVLDRGVVVEGGVVAVRQDAGSADAVRMDRDVRVTGAGSGVMGSRVSAGRDSLLDRVVSNGGDLSTARIGELVTGLALPLDVTVPTSPVLPSGDAAVSVALGASTTLAPGSYGKLSIARDAQVEFRAGQYTFSEIEADRNVALTFTGSADVVVAGSVRVGRDSTLAPVDGLDASDVRWWAGGAAPAGAAVVTFDRGVDVTATLRAPDAAVSFDRDARITGSLAGRTITIGRDSRIVHQGARPEVVEPETPFTVASRQPR